MSPPVRIGVGILGGLGALLRFFVDGLVAAHLGRDFPRGTFVVNLRVGLGTAALGRLTGSHL